MHQACPHTRNDPETCLPHEFVYCREAHLPELLSADLQTGDWPLANALHEQQAALLRLAGMKHKLAAHLYTYSTLLYIRFGSSICCSHSFLW